MKILFVVCGEGLGHASRSLHLGKYCGQNGHEVHFAGYGKSYDFMKQQGITRLHRTPREVFLIGEDGFFSLKKTLWHARTIPLTLLESAATVRRLIRDNKFDAVVCDTMYGGVISAWFRRVPVIFITNQNHFNGPHGSTNPVWETLNFLIRWYLNFADHVIIPDFPPPDTISEFNIRIPKHKQSRYSFTGPFYEFDPRLFRYGQTTIFTSFGGEPYKLPMYNLLRTIADKRKDLIFDVFYTGPALPASSENFLSHGYVPNLYEHLARAKIAIVHGGLTTLHEALLFEKPVLIIMDPNHPEQQNNARKIAEMGAGLSVDGMTVTGEILGTMLEKTMLLQPLKFREAHAGINGRQRAMEIILACVNNRKS